MYERDVTSSLASMSLASRIDGIDAKLSHEFAAAFGDAVCDELEREGDEGPRVVCADEIAPTPRRRPRSPMRCTETSNEPGRGQRRVTGSATSSRSFVGASVYFERVEARRRDAR